MIAIAHRSVRAIGEAMVEFAPVEGGLYRQGFAGDTYNTAWHMARWLGRRADIGMITRIGCDTVSDAFIARMAAAGMNMSGVTRDPTRGLGLYMIELDGVERSFHYWRDTSAARHLADDGAQLAQALHGIGLAHLSGITLAILSPEARKTLFSSLATFRANGGVVSFDPNIRPRLWPSRPEMRDTITAALGVCDIALPSLDDEKMHFGDDGPEATIARMASCGVREIVVKDGAGPVFHFRDGMTVVVPTAKVAAIVDTTGAGDAFNAGYLAARVLASNPGDCIRSGQRMAAAVLTSRGALASDAALAALPHLGSGD